MAKYIFSRYNILIAEGDDIAVYNTLGNSLAVLSHDEYDFLEKIVSEGVPADLEASKLDFLDRCLINNFVIPADADERERIKEKFLSVKTGKQSLTMTILPTLSCNFNCNYCFEGADKKSSIMNAKTQDGVMHWLESNCTELQNLNVTWFGGEPTLGMDVIRGLSRRMIDLCTKKGIAYKASIITNGSLLKSENMDAFRECRISWIQITLDGPKDVHDKVRFFKSDNRGSFDVIMENVRKYQSESPIATTFRVNVDSRNEAQCYRLIDEVARELKGVKNISMYFAPIHASTTMCKHVSAYTLEALHYAEIETKLIEYAYKNGLCNITLPPHLMGVCGAAKENGLVICPNGDIHKCWETVSVDKYKIGNIADEKFNLRDAGKDWTSWSPFVEQECLDCRIMPNCMGMCTYRFLFKENYSGNSALTPCPSIKFDLENRLRLYLKKFHH